MIPLMWIYWLQGKKVVVSEDSLQPVCFWGELITMIDDMSLTQMGQELESQLAWDTLLGALGHQVISYVEPQF